MVFWRFAATACGAQQCVQGRELLRRLRRAAVVLYAFAGVTSAGSTCPAVRRRRVLLAICSSTKKMEQASGL